MEEFLLGRGQTTHRATAEATGRERRGRVEEVHFFGITLDSETVRIESDRVDVNPTLIARGDLDPHWEQISLNLVTETSESGHATEVVVGVDSEIQVAMRSGLDANEDVDTPPAGHPMPDRGPV